MVSDREPTRNGPDWASRYRAEIARLNRTTDREIDAALADFAAKLAAEQEPLGADFAAALEANRWELYTLDPLLPLTRGGQQ